MTRFALCLLLLVSVACSSHEVPAEYRPLEQIKERLGVIGSKTAISTIGRTAWVADLDAWLKRNQPGSPMYRAILRHEQEHARRQLAMGTAKWLKRYLSDKAFMWAEEQIGWYWQITELQRLRQRVYPEGVARILSGKTYKGMVSYDDALKWVRDVLGGRWTPPTE